VRWIAARSYDGVKCFNDEPPLILAAILDEAEKHNPGRIPNPGQRGVAQVNARTAVGLGLGGVTHFHGHFESLLDSSSLPNYPSDYK